MRASNYIQRFNLNIRHKPEKQHVIPNTLSRLASANTNRPLGRAADEEELNALFTASLVEMNPDFKSRIIADYKSDLNWQRISATLNANASSGENAAKLPFYKRGDDLIFRSDGIITGDHAYEPRRLCIPHPVVQNILQLTHDETGHAGYARCYEQICSS